MSTKTLTLDADIAPLLTTMSLERTGLVDAVLFAHAQRALCTSNDVHGFASITVYDKAARRLREIFCCSAFGWEKDDANNQAGIAHPGKKLRIVPCNFDEHTGNAFIQPINRSPKGEVSRVKTRCNATGWLPGLPDIPPQDGEEYKTWILGIHSVDDHPLKAELSLPIAFDGNYFTRFATRIILLTGSEDSGTPGRARDDGPLPTEVVDIPILRK